MRTRIGGGGGGSIPQAAAHTSFDSVSIPRHLRLTVRDCMRACPQGECRRVLERMYESKMRQQEREAEQKDGGY